MVFYSTLNQSYDRQKCMGKPRCEWCFLDIFSTIYNMSGRVVSDIQTQAEGESLYIQYNTDANVVNGLKNDSSYEFIGEVILKINVV